MALDRRAGMQCAQRRFHFKREFNGCSRAVAEKIARGCP
jgi:hypothetical protein